MKIKSLSALLAAVLLTACEDTLYTVDAAIYKDVYVTAINGQHITLQAVDDESQRTREVWMGKYCYQKLKQLHYGQVVQFPVEHRVYIKSHDKDGYYLQTGQRACDCMLLN